MCARGVWRRCASDQRYETAHYGHGPPNHLHRHVTIPFRDNRPVQSTAHMCNLLHMQARGCTRRVAASRSARLRLRAPELAASTLGSSMRSRRSRIGPKVGRRPASSLTRSSVAQTRGLTGRPDHRGRARRRMGDSALAARRPSDFARPFTLKRVAGSRAQMAEYSHGVRPLHRRLDICLRPTRPPSHVLIDGRTSG